MSSFTSADFKYMRKAITLAQNGIYTTDPNPRVGCVIVKDDKIIGEGWHQIAGQAHAEVNALQNCIQSPKDSTAYVTLEPCSHYGRTPPCVDRLIQADVVRVVVAMQDPNPQVAGQGVEKLKAAGIEVVVGLMQQEAELLNPGFIKRMASGKPYVRCKMAMSLDGRTAMASGESKWITAEDARADVHHLRARSAAIITGIGSIQHDDPQMNARIEDVEVKQPLRLVLDPKFQMSTDAKIFGLAGEVMIFASREAIDANAQKDKQLEQAGAIVVAAELKDADKIDLDWLLSFLGSIDVNELLVEAGATLSGAFLQAGLIDELVVYMAPHIMGSSAKGLFNLPGLDKMADKIELDIKDITAVGCDWRIVCRPKGKSQAV